MPGPGRSWHTVLNSGTRSKWRATTILGILTLRGATHAATPGEFSRFPSSGNNKPTKEDSTKDFFPCCFKMVTIKKDSPCGSLQGF